MTEDWEIETERAGQRLVSVHRRRGVALINFGFVLNLGVAIGWAVAGWTWKVFVPLGVVDVLIGSAIWGCVLADIKEERAARPGAR